MEKTNCEICKNKHPSEYRFAIIYPNIDFRRKYDLLRLAPELFNELEFNPFDKNVISCGSCLRQCSFNEFIQTDGYYVFLLTTRKTKAKTKFNNILITYCSIIIYNLITNSHVQGIMDVFLKKNKRQLISNEFMEIYSHENSNLYKELTEMLKSFEPNEHILLNIPKKDPFQLIGNYLVKEKKFYDINSFKEHESEREQKKRKIKVELIDSKIAEFTLNNNNGSGGDVLIKNCEICNLNISL